MTPEDLADIIAQMREAGDDTVEVEAKRCGGDKLPRSCRDTMSAFANTSGGVILLGVDQATGFTVPGVADPGKTMSDLAAAAAELVPPLRPRIEVLEHEGAYVVVCEVDELPPDQKPCYVSSLGLSKGSYVRVHDADQHLTDYEIQLLLSNRGQPRFDKEVVEEATTDDLNPVLTRAYVERLQESRPTAFGGLTSDEVLQRASVVAHDPDGVLRPTVAGLLAMGRYPQSTFPQLNITFVHYPSERGDDPSTGVRFLDNVSIDGPIPSMVADAMHTLRRNMSRRATISGSGREDSWEYPETALREAIVNACTHRDLSPHALGAQVQIEMYPDRLSIRNPGGLYGPVTEERLGEEGVSSSRNATLLKILEDVSIAGESRTVCENRGSGIRAMINALRAANMSLPKFSNRVSNFEVLFPNHALLSDEMVAWIARLGDSELSSSQCIALATMRGGTEMNNESYRKLTGVDSRVATAELGALVGKELVIQTGSRRWATYRISPTLIDEAEFATPQSRLSPSDRREEIKSAMGTNELSRREIERLTGLPSQVVRRWLARMRVEGVVELVGDERPTSKNVRYRIAKDASTTEDFQHSLDLGI